MGKVARSYRLDEGLVARLEARADELGQTRTVFVERALEAALGDVGSSLGRESPSSTPPRASEPAPLSEVDRAKERVKEMRAPKPYVCPAGCGGEYGSPAATCRVCGRSVAPKGES